jgi:hypothetical protein
MLSKIELEFLKSPESFDVDYRRALRHGLKFKAQRIRSDIAIHEALGVSVTEFCNGQKISNQDAFNKKAPGMGFEPMRTARSTGSQGPRVNHSAIPAC